MHQIGYEFLPTIVRGDAGAAAGSDAGVDPRVDVRPWVWDLQRTYPLDVVLGPGDGISTSCTWTNWTTETVTDGLYLTNEMCHQGLVVWPAANASWTACR
jgi:hypothetical protein